MDKVAYWKDLADYDIDSAKVIYNGGRWLYESQIDLISDLMPLNIEARYPDYKNKLASKLTQEYCGDLIQKTETLKQWIENLL